MQTRTWPIGTTKPASIRGVFQSGESIAVVAIDDGGSEGFILMDDPDNEGLKIGDRGILRLVAGGATGAKWIFERSEPCIATETE